jgi:hypothetical protein
VRHLAAALASIATVCALVLAAGADTKATPPPTDAGAGDAGTAAAPRGGYLPDPPPLTTRQQWVIDLAYRAGEVSLRGARRVALARPTATARMMGRFAVELYVGRELLDRVRFNFPLLGAGDGDLDGTRWDAPPSFERGLSAGSAVMIPHSERTTRALVVDRATGRQWPVPWPPAGADAGPGGSVTRH